MTNKFSFIILMSLFSMNSFAQFEVIPTGNNSPITELEKYGDTCFIGGQDGYLAKTFDEGATLNLVSSYGISGYANFEFQVVDGYYYYLAVQGAPYDHNYIMRSTDYGNTWLELYDTIGIFYCFEMLDTTFGSAGASFGAYALTEGNDTSWILDSLAGTLESAKSYGDSTMLFLQSGFAIYTHDRGSTWNWGYCGSAFQKEIQFMNEDTIYFVSHTGTSSQKGFFNYSYNGGANFTRVKLGHNNTTSQYEYHSRIYDLHFETSQHGYMVGHMYDSVLTTGGYNISRGVIFETNDYGLTWTPHLTPFNAELYSILQVNDSIYFIGGSNGLLIKWNKNIPIEPTNILETEKLEIVQNFNVYPNPIISSFTVQVNETELPSTLTIYDQIGNIKMMKEITAPISNVNLETFSSGIYFVEVNGSSIKVVKE